MTLPQIYDLVSKVGFPGVLIFILYGSYKRIWVWGSELRIAEQRASEWKELALSGTNAADALADLAITQRLSRQNARLRTSRRRQVAEETYAPVNRKLRHVREDD